MDGVRVLLDGDEARIYEEVLGSNRLRTGRLRSSWQTAGIHISLSKYMSSHIQIVEACFPLAEFGGSYPCQVDLIIIFSCVTC